MVLWPIRARVLFELFYKTVSLYYYSNILGRFTDVTQRNAQRFPAEQGKNSDRYDPRDL